MAHGASSERRKIVGLFAVAFMLGVAYVVWSTSSAIEDEPIVTPSVAAAPAVAAATRNLRLTAALPPDQTSENRVPYGPGSRRFRVGVVAGHWQNDPGAVCPDGLQEVDINLDIASRVVSALAHDGYDAELLPEFSDKLDGYQAAAFVSIHTDSCDVPAASGFKVAGVLASDIPDVQGRLVACLIQEYAQATDLVFHMDSITYDMTEYHAFHEIDSRTPAAIIELGFMAADRELLTKGNSQVASGVVSGIVCFLDEQ